ncbi:MAG: hypothetical protein J5979_04640 [Lachnospiraceae bacterium]|nr:hypothetical protein [Lachnospiraceae bacterium]
MRNRGQNFGSIRQEKEEREDNIRKAFDWKAIEKIKAPSSWEEKTIERIQTKKTGGDFHLGWRKGGIVFVPVCLLIILLSTKMAFATGALEKLGTFLDSVFIIKEQSVEKNDNTAALSEPSGDVSDDRQAEQITGVKVSRIPSMPSFAEVENGFLISEDGEKVYDFQGDRLVEAEKQICTGEIIFNQEKRKFSFDYVRRGDILYELSTSGAVEWVLPQIDKKNRAVMAVQIGDYATSCYVDLSSGETRLISDKIENDVLRLAKKQNSTIYEMMPSDISQNGRFILYRSNVEEIRKGKKLDDEMGRRWYVYDTRKKQSYLLPDVSPYLQESDFTFIDNIHLGIAYLGEGETDGYAAGIYHLKKHTMRKLNNENPVEAGSMVSVHYQKGVFHVVDVVSGRKYKIPADESWRDAGMRGNRSVLCLFNENLECKVLWLKSGKVVDFSKEVFSDIGKVEMVYNLTENKFLIEGTGGEDSSWFLLELK